MTTPSAAQPDGRSGWEQQPAAGQAQPAQQPSVWGQQETRAYANVSATTSGTYTTAAYTSAAAEAPAAARTAMPATYDFRKGAAPAEPVQPAVTAPPGHPRPVRSGLGGLGVSQLLTWQLAAAAVLAAYRVSDVMAAVVAAVALVVVSPTLIRLRGRWLYRWFGVWLRYRGRPRSAPGTGAGAALDLLTYAEASVAPASVQLDDQEVALLTHGGGLCAVLALGPDENTLLGGEPVRLPTPATLLPGPEAHAIPITAQLLVSVSAAPVVGPGVVERSYRELTGGEVPAQRRSWLVLQAVRTSDAYLDAELQPALLSAVRRARRHLRAEKVGVRILDRDGLVSAIGHLGRLSDAGRGAPRHPVGRAAVRAVPDADPGKPASREAWRSISVEETSQSCHRLAHWPLRAWQPADLLLSMPALAGVLSVAVTHASSWAAEGEDMLVEVAFRLIGRDATALSGAERALSEAVRAAGGRTERLDGEQVFGLAATLPLGGFR